MIAHRDEDEHEAPVTLGMAVAALMAMALAVPCVALGLVVELGQRAVERAKKAAGR